MSGHIFFRKPLFHGNYTKISSSHVIVPQGCRFLLNTYIRFNKLSFRFKDQLLLAIEFPLLLPSNGIQVCTLINYLADRFLRLAPTLDFESEVSNVPHSSPRSHDGFGNQLVNSSCDDTISKRGNNHENTCSHCLGPEPAAGNRRN